MDDLGCFENGEFYVPRSDHGPSRTIKVPFDHQHVVGFFTYRVYLRLQDQHDIWYRRKPSKEGKSRREIDPECSALAKNIVADILEKIEEEHKATYVTAPHQRVMQAFSLDRFVELCTKPKKDEAGKNTNVIDMDLTDICSINLCSIYQDAVSPTYRKWADKNSSAPISKESTLYETYSDEEFNSFQILRDLMPGVTKFENDIIEKLYLRHPSLDRSSKEDETEAIRLARAYVTHIISITKMSLGSMERVCYNTLKMYSFGPNGELDLDLANDSRPEYARLREHRKVNLDSAVRLARIKELRAPDPHQSEIPAIEKTLNEGEVAPIDQVDVKAESKKRKTQRDIDAIEDKPLGSSPKVNLEQVARAHDITRGKKSCGPVEDHEEAKGGLFRALYKLLF